MQHKELESELEAYEDLLYKGLGIVETISSYTKCMKKFNLNFSAKEIQNIKEIHTKNLEIIEHIEKLFPTQEELENNRNNLLVRKCPKCNSKLFTLPGALLCSNEDCNYET